MQYRLDIDQISNASLTREQTHTRYFLEWLQDSSFSQAQQVRPTLPQYLLTNRLDGDDVRLQVFVFIYS